MSLYHYYQPADGTLDSKGPLSRMIAQSVFTKVNKEVKHVAAGQKKRQGSYELYLSFIPVDIDTYD